MDAVNAVHGLLNLIPLLRINSVDIEKRIGPRDSIMDGFIELVHADKTYALVIEAKGRGQPRYVRDAIFQVQSYVSAVANDLFQASYEKVVPILVVPYLSPDSRQMCIDHGINYLDLYGNARLAFGSVFIERTVADKPKSETRALRSIFSPKAAAILRIILQNPSETWRVTELAERGQVSLGHVSNVRKALLDREWIEEHDDGVVLTNPKKILKTWRKNYRRPSGHRLTGYTQFHGAKLEDRLRDALGINDDRSRAICSLHSAAKWISPFARDGMNSFYADEGGTKQLEHVLHLSPTSKGANVSINIIKDDSIFVDAIEPVRGIFCTSPIQTYLDLWNGNDRDQEAAEYLLKENYPWLN